jgi:hypothetical protein
MNINETIVVVVLILAAVIVVALSKFKRVEARGQSKGIGEFKIHAEGKIIAPPQEQLRSKKGTRKVQGIRPWFSSHWRAVVIWSSIVLIIVAPVWWWVAQPAPWRMLLSYEFNEMFRLLRHSSKEPLHITRGQATLDRVTRMVEMRTDRLSDRYRDEEIWVVDHYWQYWNTDNLREYLSVNKMFVARGGKIHRLFFLTNEELQDPDVQTMLQAQCRIGKLGDDQTGNGFELWRADPKIMRNQEEYEAISRQFRQLPNTDKSFENFDVVQFKDTLYYSSDFSTDYRVMGSSTWIFDPNQVSKMDLRPLFKKSIAQRIPCDQPLPVLNAEKHGRHSGISNQP